MVLLNWIVSAEHQRSVDVGHQGEGEVSCEMPVPLVHLNKNRCRETNDTDNMEVIYMYSKTERSNAVYKIKLCKNTDSG